MLLPQPRNLQSQSGIVIIEVALVLPILIAITFGLLSLGSIFIVHNNMLNAARETARSLAVGEITLSEAQTTAANHLIDWENLTFTVIPTEPNPSDVSVQITTPMSEAAMIDVLGIFDSGVLQAQVTMRKEIG